MKVIGITGTNGKTTVTHIVSELLEKAGFKVGKIGTLTGRLTTPSPWEMQELLAGFKKEQKDFVVMEVSSHGIHQDRVKGIFFFVKLLTNITQDHLDYHKTFRAYKNVKLGWMKRGSGIKIYPKDFLKQKIDFKHPYLGEFNHHNVQAAYAIVKALNVLPEQKLKALFGNLSYVPGRFEKVCEGQPFKVIVDYAHTHDGLQNIISSCRAILKKEKSTGRIITVFGSGGDRDRGKRPKMAKVAYTLSDQIIITNDNPRTEDPQQILQDILAGIPRPCFWQKKKLVRVELDRGKAIRLAIGSAQEGDFVILAGKGHEPYQILGDKRIHFDDREEARAALKKWPTL